MKKLLLLFFISVSLFSYSQNDTAKTNLGLSRINDSSLNAKLSEIQRVNDSLINAVKNTSTFDAQSTERFFNEFNESKRKKEKRDAFIRIGIGVAMLLVLVVGLRRRKAKKN